jgi:hypothetical protein
MTAPVLMLGGYGSVGSRISRMLRRLQPDLPIAIVGRDLSRAEDLADKMGNATAGIVNLERVDLGLPRGADYSIVVTALRDLSLNTMRFAQARRIPYVALSDGVFEIGPTAVRFAHRPDAAPILLLGHGMGAVPVLAALHCASGFRTIDAIEVGLVFDPADPLGPASRVDMDRIGATGPSPLILNDGRWQWITEERTRRFTGVDGSPHEGQAVGLIDVLSLSASTARSIRVDFAEAATASSKRGEPPSHEVIIEITGEHADRGEGRFRYELVDLDGYATLSARGIAVAVECLLGLGGRSAPKAGLYLPESILNAQAFVNRLRDLGVTIEEAQLRDSRGPKVNARGLAAQPSTGVAAGA